jgi:cytochrome oxidase assembly protein ShyY1
LNLGNGAVSASVASSSQNDNATALNAGPRGRRSGVVLPAIFTLIIVSILAGLGKWQIDRKAWKEALIATLTERLAAAPAELPPPERWAELHPETDEFRRVRFAAELMPGQEALIFTSGSSFRPDVSGPGYWVFAPARLPGGGVIVVDRGFAPQGWQDEAAHEASAAAAPVEMVGYLRWPETPSWLTPAPEPGHNLWFLRDQRLIAQAKNWGEVAPFYIDLERPQPSGGVPVPGPLAVTLPNDHLQYAITWFGLAAVVTIAFGFWLRGRLANGE